MDETKRFLRYVIPGLLFFIELLLYLFISDRTSLISFLKEWSDSIAFPVTIFLASGGIGFFLSILYYSLYRVKFLKSFYGDYSPLIKDCINKGWLKIQHRNDEFSFDIKYLSHSGAWRIVTSFWQERKESSNRIKAANTRTDSLADMMQGLGASFAGSLIAVIMWIFIHFIIDGNFSQIIIVLLIAIIVVFLHWINYCNIRKDLYSLVSIIMIDELNDIDNKDKPIEMYVSQEDLICNVQAKIEKSNKPNE